MAGTRDPRRRLLRHRLSPSDTATVVARLQAAGAVIVGKTQLTEGAWGTAPPGHRRRRSIPGRPITGPASPPAALAWRWRAGLAYGAIGTDTAGSIRFPSACDHLAGLKPTWGRVSRHGVFPLSDTFDHVGPMTRTVLDAALMFEAIDGADPLDATALRRAGDRRRRRRAQAARCRASGSGSTPPMRSAGLDEPTERALRGRHRAPGEGRRRDRRGQRARGRARSSSGRSRRRCVEAAVWPRAPASRPSGRSTAPPSPPCSTSAGRPVLDYAAIAIWRREFRGGLARLFATSTCWSRPRCRSHRRRWP